MAVGWSDALENKIINHFLRNISQTPDASLFVALFTVAHDDAGAGGTEVSAGDYTRKAITFVAPTAGVTSNNAQIDFVASAASAWGTIVAVAIYNASTAGTMLGQGPVSPSLVVGIGSPVSIAVGQLTFTVD